MARRVAQLSLAVSLLVFSNPNLVSGAALEPNDPSEENPVMVSEIYTDAPAGVSEKDPLQGEFIELHNPTDSSLALTGFSLEIVTAGSGTTYAVDLSGRTLAPFEYMAVRDLDSTINFSLANEGATVELKYTVGTLALTLSSITYTALPSENSWSLVGEDWVVGLPTPGAANQAKPLEEEPPGPDCDIDNVLINEILANPGGSDADGGEFIELYNAGSTTASLAGCKIKTDKLPELELGDISLQAGGYYALALTDDLLNSGGNVWFITKHSEEIVEYSALGDDEAWAIINGSWQLTLLSTPGSANLPTPEEEERAEEGLKPCPAGKFRNPETNRCKNIVDTAGSLLPCQPGEARNPSTNRCRRISALSSSLTPCKPGQERNPATNRCRSTSSTGTSLQPCQPGQERNPETNRCRKSSSGVAGTANFGQTKPSELHNGLLVTVVLMSLAYGLWEYRLDLANWLAKFRAK